jgi:hypothetical protein
MQRPSPLIGQEQSEQERICSTLAQTTERVEKRQLSALISSDLFRQDVVLARKRADAVLLSNGVGISTSITSFEGISSGRISA